MEKVFKSEKELLESIIRVEGKCLNAVWCMMCPFNNECIGSAITKAKLLPEEERVKRAYNKLFDELMEDELDDAEES